MPETNTVKLRTVKVIGIGGAGGSIVAQMAAKETPGADFIAMNTNETALQRNPCEKKILLKELDYNEIWGTTYDMLRGGDLVVLVAGLGGQTGSIGIPAVAYACSLRETPVVCLITVPFAAEGAKRMETARASIQKLCRYTENIAALPLENEKRRADQSATIKDFFENVDAFICQAALGILAHIERVENFGLSDTDWAEPLRELRGKGFILPLYPSLEENGMALSEKAELVRRYFEDEDGKALAERLREPEMESAICEYVAARNAQFRPIEGFDISRLIRLSSRSLSDALRDTLFCALDAWAELRFETRKNRNTAAMRSYLQDVARFLPDSMSPELMTNPSCLRQIALIRDYLNGLSAREEYAARWREHFSECFEGAAMRDELALIFLYMLLDQEEAERYKTPLNEETEALLVRCGYEYISRTQDPRQVILSNREFSIFSNVMERSIKKCYYQREWHAKAFKNALPFYLFTCLHNEFIPLLMDADSVLLDIVCYWYEELFFISQRVRVTKWMRERMADLALAIPKRYMPAPRWENILNLVKEWQNFYKKRGKP